MKRLGALTLLAGLLALATPQLAQSQENRLINPDCNIICSPVFVNQSSGILTNFIDAPEGVDSELDFLARVTTAFGTQFNPLFIVALIQWTPFNKAEGTDVELNAPTFVYGPGFHVLGGSGAFVDLREAGQYVALDLLPLLVYNADPTGEALYNHKFVPEADFFLHIGKLIDPNNRAPYINSTSIHVILDYVTDALGTFIPEGTPEAAEPSRWVLIFGLTTPIAPLPGG